MAGTTPIGKWLLTVFSSMLGSTWKAQIDANFSVAQRVADAFAPHAQDTPDMTVVVDAGFIVATTPTGLQAITEVAQQTVTIGAAPASPNNRIDLIVIDGGTGTASVIAGTPAGTPSAPTLPAGKRQVAQISVPNGTTSIGPSNITDLRSVWSGNVPGVPWAVAGGSADAITASYTPANAALVDGMILAVRFNAANTATAPTFAPDGLTAHPITKAGGAALIAGDIAGAGAEGLVRYNEADTRWELLNPKPVPPPVTSVAGKTGAVTLAHGDLTDGANVVMAEDGVSRLTNDANFAVRGEGVSEFSNDAGYIKANSNFSWTLVFNSSTPSINVHSNWGSGAYIINDSAGHNVGMFSAGIGGSLDVANHDFGCADSVSSSAGAITQIYKLTKAV